MLLENNPFPSDIRPRREAAALLQAGWRVSCISPRPTNAKTWREEFEGVQVYYFPAPPELGGFIGYLIEYGYATTIMALLSVWVLLRHGFDVLHVHNPPDTFFWLGAFYRLLGKKFIFDHHDLSPEMYDARNENGTGRKDGTRSNPIVRQVLVWCEVLTCKAANLIIATNGSYKQLEIERSGVPESRIHIVRNGPDPVAFYPVPPDAELRAKAKTLLGYVGIMGPQDGVDYALRALAHLRHTLKRDDFYAVFIGQGEMLTELKKLVVELDIADHVWFTGRIPYADLLRTLSTVDICLGPDPGNPFTSRSTMIKLMEYMAMHKPIVAFDLTEHHVSAGEAALYAPANDEAAFAQCIQTLMDNPAQRQHMGELGYERITNGLAWPFQAQRLLEAYAALGLQEAPTQLVRNDLGEPNRKIS